jgi:hypothetical protein
VGAPCDSPLTSICFISDSDASRQSWRCYVDDISVFWCVPPSRELRGDRVECIAKDYFLKMSKNGEVGFKIAVADGLLLYYDQFSFYSQKVKVGGGGGRRHESGSPIRRWMFCAIMGRRLCKKVKFFWVLFTAQ